MSDMQWAGTPLSGVSQWTEEQAIGGHGVCKSCGKITWLRPDPYVGQLSCRPCWEALVYGADFGGEDE